ncbi:MAG: helix-turn-helix domain-containing protein [Kiritimatiellaeota bacterium]|nr:helix-turn-helix domain-containing protein [Kiritimatiellota bacterium]
MRRPVGVRPWFSEIELLAWLREASSAEEHRRRMVIWLTHFRRWHAREIAEMVGVSVQAVWKWVGQYNRHGFAGLIRRGRGGRRWSYLSEDQERDLLHSLEERTQRGDILTAKQILPLACQAAGRKVSLGYVYALLHRHDWRKLGPRPHHANSDPEVRKRFNKNSQN